MPVPHRYYSHISRAPAAPAAEMPVTSPAALETHALETHQALVEQGLPPLLQPGVVCADHSPGIIAASQQFYPKADVVGCYPHVRWHMSHGKLLRKDHPKFDEISCLLPVLHTCQTVGMWDVLVFCIGKIWGDKDQQLNKLWASLFVAPHNRWFIGATDCPAAEPSQQPQASGCGY